MFRVSAALLMRRSLQNTWQQWGLPNLPIIKTVNNGDPLTNFKAVSLGHAVAIVFGLLSIIGGQQTWLWAEAHERDLIVATIRAQIITDIDRHANADNIRFDFIERRLIHIESGLDEALKQLNKNTGNIESNRSFHERRNSP